MEKTNRLRIQTPEGVEFSLYLAGPVPRFLAWLVDIGCIMAASELIGIIFWFFGLLSRDLADSLRILAYFLLSVGYGIGMEWWLRGRTPGKILLRLRVMDERGLKLRFSQVVLRNLLRFVDSLPALYLVGGLATLFSKRSQRLGDIVANTIVVRMPGVEQPDLDRLFGNKYNSFRDYPHLTARLRQRSSVRESEIALQAVLRRDALDPAARVALFAAVADHFREKVAFPEAATDGLSDEQYVRNVTDILFREGGA